MDRAEILKGANTNTCALCRHLPIVKATSVITTVHIFRLLSFKISKIIARKSQFVHHKNFSANAYGKPTTEPVPYTCRGRILSAPTKSSHILVGAATCRPPRTEQRSHHTPHEKRNSPHSPHPHLWPNLPAPPYLAALQGGGDLLQ